MHSDSNLKASQTFTSISSQSWGQGLVLLFLFIALPLTLTSCGGGDTKDESKSSGKGLESSMKRAEDARDAAKEEGADELYPDEFEEAEGFIAEAKEKIEEGKEKTAKSRLSKARSRFATLIKKCESYNKAEEEFAEADEAVKKARALADQAQAGVNAKDEYSKATADYSKIYASYEEETDSGKIKSLARKLKYLENTFKSIATRAKDNKLIKEKAEQELKALAQLKKEAIEAEAEKYALRTFKDAEQLERGGTTDLKNGRFQQAYADLQRATTLFTDAIQQAKSEKKFQEQLASNNNGSNPQNNGNPNPQNPVNDNGSSDPDVAVNDNDTDTGPDLSGLTDEEIIIAENIGKLLPSLASKISNYDPSTGEVTLNYGEGKTLQKDVSKAHKNMDFRNTMIPKSSTPKPTPQGLQPPGNNQNEPTGDVSFMAHTGGAFVIPIPLKSDLTIQFTTQVLTMDGSGHMGPWLMVESKGKTRWYANFCTLQKFTNGSRKGTVKSTIKERNRPANNWFDKKNPIPMIVESLKDPDDEKKAIIKIFHAGEDEPSCATRIKSDTSGFIGWSWSRTKFMIMDLTIKGTIDKAKVVEILKKKGVDFGAAPKSRTKKNDKVASNTPKNSSSKRSGSSKKSSTGTTLADEFDY